MKAVHFGAGNIGRGFIGQLLHRAGCQVTFADVNDELIRLLKQEDSYQIFFAAPDQKPETITNFTGLHSQHEKEELLTALREADLVTTAVGAPVLKHLAPVLAEAVKERLDSALPLTVIACENAVGGTDMLRAHVEELLSKEESSQAEALISWPNAAVDRIVPIQEQSNPLDVLVEPFYEWTVEKKAIHGPVPPIEGIQYVDDLDAYIERKLFTVNTGHAAAAYHGWQKQHATVQEAMKDSSIRSEVESVLKETGKLLTAKYSFDPYTHAAYIQTTLSRFENAALSDSIERVARQPLKKLGARERLVSPALQLEERGMNPEALLRTIAAALAYDNLQDEEAAQLHQQLAVSPASFVLGTISGLDPDSPIVQKAAELYEAIQAS